MTKVYVHNKIRKFFYSEWFRLFLPFAFYFSGGFFLGQINLDYLKRMGYAEQEVSIIIDSEGEEYEREGLIKILGIGKVLTYEDLYYASIFLFFIALLFGKAVFTEEECHEGVFKQVIFANCLLGMLLIWTTTKEYLVSTICFWLGIISARITLITMSNNKYST